MLKTVGYCRCSNDYLSDIFRCAVISSSSVVKKASLKLIDENVRYRPYVIVAVSLKMGV